MMKRLSILLLLFVAALAAGCDSSDSIATVTARADGTLKAQATVTALSVATATRTPTLTPAPSETPTPVPITPTEAVSTGAPPQASAVTPVSPAGPSGLVTVTALFPTLTPSLTPETQEPTMQVTPTNTAGTPREPAVTVTPLFLTMTPSPTSENPPTPAATATNTVQTTPNVMGPPVTVTPLFPTMTPTSAEQTPTTEATQAATQAGAPNVQAEAISGSPVRAEPNPTARAVGLVAKGRAVIVVGRYENWLQIEFQSSSGTTGWLPSDILKVTSGDISSLPTVNVQAITGAATTAPTPVPVDANVAWFGQTTIYSLFVRSFRDTNGDGIGDLRGVIEELDYIQSLGADTIWLLPVFVSPTYHGYDTIDYYKVNPDYGTNDDLVTLFKAAHARNMYVLLDYAINHTSDQHPFFKDALGNPQSQYAEYYLWQNAEHTKYAAFANFGPMPELNFDSNKVRQFATDIALHWLDPNGDGDFSDGADGYRCDVAISVPADFWAELRTAMKARNPRAVLLGELWTEAAQIGRYLQGDGLTSSFDFPTWTILMGADPNQNGGGVLSGDTDPSLLALSLRAMARYAAPNTFLARFSHNHDTNRLVSEVNGDMARARAAAVWLLTVPGIPTIYYGEEIGMKGVKGSGPEYYDEYRREPMDWYADESGPDMTTWFKPDDRNNAPGDGISVEEEAESASSLALLKVYRELGRLRVESEALRGPNFELPRHPSLYIVQRWSGDEVYLVVINFTKTAQSLDNLSGYFQVGGNTYRAGQPFLTQGYSDRNDRLTLEPAGYAVFRAGRN